MNVEIRKSAESDRAERARLFNVTWPGFFETEESIRLDDESWPESAPFERWMAERDGRVVACLSWSKPYWVKVEGILGAAVLMADEDPDFVELQSWVEAEAMKQNPTGLRTWARTDLPIRMEKLESMGYRRMEESRYFELIPANFDEKPFQDAKTRLEAEGLRFVTFEQLESEGYDWKRPLYDATSEMVEDIPAGEQMTMESYEDYLKGLDPWNYHPPLMYAVMEGDTIAAYSRLARLNGKPTVAWTAFGGTTRAYRRRGIMIALKAWSIADARDRHAIEQIATDNLSHNPMAGINERLGFRDWFTSYKMGKDFKGKPTSR